MHKARHALHNQALQAENGLYSAPTFAEAWRSLAKSARELLPTDCFLDSRRLVPQLKTIQRTAVDLQRTQVSAARDQDKQTRDSVERTIHQYLESFASMLKSARETTQNAQLVAALDFGTSERAFTGRMSAGTQDTVRQARAARRRIHPARSSARPAAWSKRASGSYARECEPTTSSRSRATSTTTRAKSIARLGALEAGLFPAVNTAVENELSAAVRALDNMMPETSAGGYVGSAAAGQAAVPIPILGALIGRGRLLRGEVGRREGRVDTITGVLRPGRPALEDQFNNTRGNLRERLDDKLSEDEAEVCKQLLNGTAEGDAEARRVAVNSEQSTWFFGVSAEERDAVTRGLNADELRRLSDPGGARRAEREATEGIAPVPIEMDNTYLDRRRAQQLTSEVAGQFERAREQGNSESVAAANAVDQQARQAIAGQYYAGLVSERRVDQLLTEVYREHAAQQDVSDARGRGESLTLEDARERERAQEPDQVRERFATWATRTFETVETDSGGGEGPATTYTVRHELSGEAAGAVRDVIHRRSDATDAQQRADAAWVSSARFQIARAQGESSPSENTQNAVTRSVLNPRLDAAHEAWLAAQTRLETARHAQPEDQARIEEEQWHTTQAFQTYQRERTTHDRRMGVLAGQLGAKREQLQGPQAASQYVGGRWARSSHASIRRSVSATGSPSRSTAAPIFTARR